jgi:hypothetical protein
VPSYDVYQGCGSTKTCFGIPSHCVPNRNCDMLSAVTYENPNFTFELLSTGKLYILMDRVGIKDFWDIILENFPISIFVHRISRLTSP